MLNLSIRRIHGRDGHATKEFNGYSQQKTCDRRRRRIGRAWPARSSWPRTAWPSICSRWCRSNARTRSAQGGINACNDIARQQGYSEWEHFDETISAAIFSPTSRRCWRWPTGRRRSSICSIAWACRSTARPKASAICACSAARCSSEPSSPARRPASNCSTRSMSKPAAGKPKARVNKYEFWEFLWPVIHDGQLRRHRRAGHADDADQVVPRRCRRHGDRRQRADLRQDHDVASSAPAAPRRAAIRPARSRQPGDDPGPSHRHPRRRQVPADLRIRPRRRRPRLGAAQSRATRARPIRFPKPSAITSSKRNIPSTATSSRATSPPAKSSRSARRAWASAAETWSISTCATK